LPKRGLLPKREMDFSVLVVTLMLVLTGIVVVFSASSYMATIKIGDPYFYFKKQILGAVIGSVAILFLSRFDYHKYQRFTVVKWGAVVIPVLMLLAVRFVPALSVSLNGSSRWLNLGFITIQPSEIAKFALVVYMSIYMAEKRHDMMDFTKGVVPMLAVVGGVCLLILLQPNFSMVMCIAIITLIMLYVGGARKLHLGVMCSIGVVAVIALIIVEPYRMERLMAFLDPFADPSDTGYQLIQSFYALASGGLFGRGLGMSQQKLLFLPYGESDFVFSVYAEEFGFFGVLLLLSMYLFLIYRGVRISATCKDKFGSLLAAGVTALIGVQVIINVAVVTGSMPPTGQTLPFISAGSSSLIMFMAATGVLMNISKNCVKT